MSVQELERRIEAAYASGEIAPAADAVEETIRLLDGGELRVAELRGEEWVVNEWVKKAILLFFRLQKMEPIEVGPYLYYDKIPLKRDFAERNVRVVPPAVARYGAFLSPGVVLMPSYTNIGAWVGPGTMVDTWATVGSCAQIGANVHLAGGVGIGGVLEPPNARPVIVEDNCFVGSRAIVTEGVRVCAGAGTGRGGRIPAHGAPPFQPPPSALYSVTRFDCSARRVVIRACCATYSVRCASRRTR